MTTNPISQCPPGCDFAGTDRHDVDATAEGATVVHHQRRFGPVTVYVDEILGRPTYAIAVHVEEMRAQAPTDPAVALTQLAGAALRAATYVAQLSSPPTD